jgi:rod shape-determining protein MreB
VSLFDRLFGFASVDLGIDLGTANTLVCTSQSGIVLNEPSVVAVNSRTGKVMNDGQAVGQVAKDMLGRTPGGIEAVRPLKDGVISDFEVTEAMLRYFIRKATGKKWISPRVVIAIPGGITQVEKRAVKLAAERAGGRRIYLVAEPFAAAIGAGLPVSDPTASMIIDIGGGTTDVAIISLADVSVSQSVRVAGDDFDNAIVSHMKKNYNMSIGPAMAEQIKVEIGSAGPEEGFEENARMMVGGRDLIGGLPRRVEIGAGEVREALAEPVNQIVEAVSSTLEKCPPELAADLLQNGITLAGGSALLRGLPQVIQTATGLDARLADDPLTCVARGTTVFIENLETFKETMESDEDDY